MRAQDNPLKARIVHLTSAHSRYDTRIFHKECQSLARAGYAVILLSTHSSNEEADGVLLVGVGNSKGRVHRVTAKVVALCREALRLKGDVYHIHDPELLVIAVLFRALGKKVVYDIHEDLPRTFSYKKYLPEFLRSLLARVIEPWENLAARCMSGLVTATPTINKRFSTIHLNSVVVNNYPLQDELAQASRVEWNQRSNSVAYVGGVSEERGIREMLAAMELLPPQMNVKLELAGPLSSSKLYSELASGQFWRHVNWNRTLDRKGISSLLGRVRVGLAVAHPEPNLLFSQPVKLFEYMAAGIPVIASDFPQWRSLIEDSRCCLFVDPLNPRAIAEAIEELLKHPTEAEAMGKRGREAVERRFNWNAEERVLLSFYSRLLDGAEVPVSPSPAWQPFEGAQ